MERGRLPETDAEFEEDITALDETLKRAVRQKYQELRLSQDIPSASKNALLWALEDLRHFVASGRN